MIQNAKKDSKLPKMAPNHQKYSKLLKIYKNAKNR